MHFAALLMQLLVLVFTDPDLVTSMPQNDSVRELNPFQCSHDMIKELDLNTKRPTDCTVRIRIGAEEQSTSTTPT